MVPHCTRTWAFFIPIGAYLSLSNQFDMEPLLFSLAVLFWVAGFDIIYALQDEEFDKQHQLTPSQYYLAAKSHVIGLVLHVISFFSLLVVGFLFNTWSILLDRFYVFWLSATLPTSYHL